MRDNSSINPNHIDYIRLGGLIKAKREALGLSLRDAADLIGDISYTTLNRLERGTASPDVATLQKVLAWLDLPMSSLFRGSQVVRAHLRALKRLPPGAAEAVADVVRHVQVDSAGLGESPDVKEAPTRDRIAAKQREYLAVRFRKGINYELDVPLDPFRLEIAGVRVQQLAEMGSVPPELRARLLVEHETRWSAITLPLNAEESSWLIVLNSQHSRERQHATLMEEYCHILLGHHLTSLQHVEGQTFRDYDEDQEKEAYGLGAAILVPRKPLIARVVEGQDAATIGAHFGVSPELIEYRIKVTGAWLQYKLQRHVRLQ